MILAQFNVQEVDQTFREENSIDKRFQEVQQENFILVHKIEELEDQVAKLKKLMNSDQLSSNYLLDELAEKNMEIKKLEEKLDQEVQEKMKLIEEVKIKIIIDYSLSKRDCPRIT